MSLTENQRRVLTAAGVQVTEGSDASLALGSIPVRVIDHPTDPDTVYVVNTAELYVSPPGGWYPSLDDAALAGLKVRLGPAAWLAGL